MLSVDECKKYLKGYDEKQVEAVRNELYQLATLLIDSYDSMKLKTYSVPLFYSNTPKITPLYTGKSYKGVLYKGQSQSQIKI